MRLVYTIRIMYGVKCTMTVMQTGELHNHADHALMYKDTCIGSLTSEMQAMHTGFLWS